MPVRAFKSLRVVPVQALGSPSAMQYGWFVWKINDLPIREQM